MEPFHRGAKGKWDIGREMVHPESGEPLDIPLLEEQVVPEVFEENTFY